MGKRKNSTKKERTALLKKLGYTEDDMQRFWDECITVNSKIKMISDSGMNWTDLCVWQIEQLPTLKEKTLQQLAEKEEAQRKDEQEKQRKTEAEKYYQEHFDEIILDKIENHLNLTEDELRTLVFEYEHESTESSDIYKNMRAVETIINLKDRFFCINWSQDIGDWGEHQFYNQPYEVEQLEKVVKTKYWVKVDEAKKIKEAQNKPLDYNTITDEIIDAITEFMFCNYGNCGMKDLDFKELKNIQEYIKCNIRN